MLHPISSLVDPIEGMSHTDFLNIIAQYKFSLAMENAVCSDYITEKMWRPLVAGSVPIVFGSPHVKVGNSSLSPSCLELFMSR
jgi:hypothetical protein